ncbi:MAG: EamA family transporter [Parasporobacterium sp.]|nr:EamA family transporter [Parasporobacterium sp.]
MNEKKNDPGSMIMLIVSALIFGSVGIFRRFIPLPSAMLACFRGLSGAAFLFLALKVQKKKFRHGIGRKKVWGLIAAGAAIGVNWILLFEAYNYTTVATATLCYYMQPTIVILMSALLFREKLGLNRVICLIISVVGMFFVSGVVENLITADPGQVQQTESGILLEAAAAGTLPPDTDTIGILCGLGAAVFYATVIIINKKIPGVDAYEKTIIELVSASVVVIPYMLFTSDISDIHLDTRAVIMLLIVGFIHTGLAYAMYFGSMDGLKTQSIAIISYIDPVTALILSSIILKEKMSVFGIIGAVMILASAVYSETEGILRRKKTI